MSLRDWLLEAADAICMGVCVIATLIDAALTPQPPNPYR
jgi:hypothetical protein